MDLYSSKFKVNAFGLASTLSKAFESVTGSRKDAKDANSSLVGGQSGMLNNNPYNDLATRSNYNYSLLNGNDCAAAPSTTHSSKFDADYTPRCMRPKSMSFKEEEEAGMRDQQPHHQQEQNAVSPPVLMSSTNPFLPSESRFNTKPFIYNDLRGDNAQLKSNYFNDASDAGQEMQEMKSSRKSGLLETNFESLGSEGTKGDKQRDDTMMMDSYKMNVGVPMVGMVPNAELVKIAPQPALTPTTPQTRPVAGIHFSEAVPLSSIFGLPPTLSESPDVTVHRSPPSPQLNVNPNSKSTDIF